MIMKAIDQSGQKPGRVPRHAARPTRIWLGSHAAALGLISILIPLHRWWSAQLLLAPLLLIAPGLILLRALRIPGEVVSSFPAYVPCASIIVLFGSGLTVDIVGPLLGVTAPLRATPLLVGFDVICLALLATSVNASPTTVIRWHSPYSLSKLAWLLVLPAIAAAGALRLNSGHGNGVALIALCVLVVMLIMAAVFSSRFDETLLRTVLYATGLAMVWSDSLRGDPLYGFDIATEYQRLQQTIVTGIWHTAHSNDAYGAMVSVTVMPTEFHALSGIPGLLVLKVVYPAIYAFFPIAIFDLARKVLSYRWAFVAAAFTIGQYAFAEMAGFARQEIALVFFAALVAAMLDTRMQRRQQWALVALLGVAMALSHYSTTYVAVTVIGLLLPMQWVVSRFREIPRVTGAAVVAFIATFAGAVIWYAPITSSDSHVLNFAQTVQVQGLNILPNRVPGGSLLSAYLLGNTKTPIPAAKYEQEVRQYYSINKPFIVPLKAANRPQYALRDSPVPEPAVKWRAGYDSFNLGLLIIEQLANLLAGIGALLMALRRQVPVIGRQVGLLALAATLLLMVLRFSGTLAVAYGQERAQLQGLVLLTVSMCWCLQAMASARHGRVVTVTAACLAVVLVNTTYLVGAVFGGYISANLTNSGRAFEYLYVTVPEISAARWLGQTVQPGELVYTDEYGQVRLAAVTDIQRGLFFDLTPLTLNQHAWVYASRTNVINGRAFALYNEHLATYSFPASFLEANYNLVYTNGSSEVFHR